MRLAPDVKIPRKQSHAKSSLYTEINHYDWML